VKPEPEQREEVRAKLTEDEPKAAISDNFSAAVQEQAGTIVTAAPSSPEQVEVRAEINDTGYVLPPFHVRIEVSLDADGNPSPVIEVSGGGLNAKRAAIEAAEAAEAAFTALMGEE